MNKNDIAGADTLGMAFAKLYAETICFHDRFNLGEGKTPLLTALRVFHEEAGEVYEAAARQAFAPTSLQPGTREALAEELADLFVTAIGVGLQAGIDVAEFEAAFQHVVEKNRAKTADNTRRDQHGKVIKNEAGDE